MRKAIMKVARHIQILEGEEELIVINVGIEYFLDFLF
jgi:hypothetical protein